MKKVLICAFYFPPFVGPSEIIGSLGTAKFAKYLPDFGWQPYVLAPRLLVERAMVEDPQIANLHRRSFLDLIHVFNRFMPNRIREEYGQRELTSKSSMFLNEAVHENL